MIEKVYGKDFLEYLTPLYKKKVYNKLYEIYLLLKEKGGYDREEEDEEKEDMLIEIYQFLPILIRYNDEEPDKTLKVLYEDLNLIDIVNNTDLNLLNRIKSSKL